eukprot:TRINITY_DN2149_c0_g1_i1.p1 TRINITY_DN2149_c0_g1~~TRINITY_DN2149_c0_g1_i1.p1  ORF type:complete len:461 (+),score=126.46 TRINITY_DN2149_c0_g1_i1:90-1385(+)
MRLLSAVAVLLPVAAGVSIEADWAICGGDWYRDPTAASNANTMTLHKLPTAKCIDGSPAAYYIHRNPNSSKYIVWLEGGGACKGIEDCKLRAQSGLGSSKGYKATTAAARGMIMGDVATNPDFADWNRIFVPYCSGDLWAGQMREAANPWSDPAVPGHGKSGDTWTGWFAGHTVVSEVIAAVKSVHGADKATEVILTGCSAGGIGTLNNCDFFADSFPGARSVCRPEAGWFGLPIAMFKDWQDGKESADMHHGNDTMWMLGINPYTATMDAVTQCMQHTKGGTELPYCNQIPSPFPGQDQGFACCNAPPYFYPYTKTPMFISQNTMDAYMVSVQGLAPPTSTGYIKYLHDILAGSLTETVAQGRKQATDGLFATACLQHCPIPWSGEGAPMVGQLNNMQAFGDWYFGRGSGTRMLLDNSTNPLHYYKCAVR